jgi:hypothetical protein
MCRNIKLLHHFEPPATRDEVHASALQYVRKLSGMNKPNKQNHAAFNAAVEEIVKVTLHLFEHLVPNGPPHTREEEKAKAAARGQKREAQMQKKYGGQALPSKGA